MATARIILFDYMCTLCSKYVQLVITRDSKGVFKFASLQSETGQQLRRRHGMDPEHITTMVLIEGNQGSRPMSALARCSHGGRGTLFTNG